MNALNTIKDLIVQLTGLLVAAVGLGVVSAIVLPGDWFFAVSYTHLTLPTILLV